eukprot:360666-Chlamydomonas_euryale.AAC.8
MLPLRAYHGVGIGAQRAASAPRAPAAVAMVPGRRSAACRSIVAVCLVSARMSRPAHADTQGSLLHGGRRGGHAHAGAASGGLCRAASDVTGGADLHAVPAASGAQSAQVRKGGLVRRVHVWAHADTMMCHVMPSCAMACQLLCGASCRVVRARISMPWDGSAWHGIAWHGN